MRPKGSAPASICSPTTSPPSQIPSCTSSSQISLKAFDRHWRYGTGYTVPVFIASGNSSPRFTSALKTFTFGGKSLTPSPARPPQTLDLPLQERRSARRTPGRWTPGQIQPVKFNQAYSCAPPLMRRQTKTKKFQVTKMAGNYVWANIWR